MTDKPIINSLANVEHSQLLIIDVQEKLISSMPEKIATSVIKNINAIQEMAVLLKVPTLITEQYPKGLGNTNNNILKKHNSDSDITEKTSFSCCQAPEFTNRLQAEREQLIIVGMESHICVLQTALQLLAQDKKIFVIEDAVCSRFKKHYRNAIARMSNEGVIISNTESLLFEWLGDAAHPHFKTASKLIR